MTHWTETARRGGYGFFIGECPSGDLWLPTRGGRGDERWFGRRLDLRRPTHWHRYAWSRLRRRIVWLDHP